MAIDEFLSDSRAVEGAEQYRRRKTTSVLAIVFTDIANSTALREQLGEVSYERFREDYDAQFSRLVESEEGGAVVKSTGDGALAVFSEPSTAVEQCLRVQRELGDHTHFKLRVGIDMGQVSVKAAQGIVRDVFGRHVNRAARIQSLAEPGHVLTSFHVFDCAVGWLKATSISWHNHGVAELKGFEGLVSIHEAYDSSISRPQSSAAFRPIGQVMFSRAAPRDRPIRLGTAEWDALWEELRTEPLTIRPLTFTDSEDPYSNYSWRLSVSVESLTKLVPEAPSVLWAGGDPETRTREHTILRDAGCDLYLAASAQDAREQMSKRRYFLAVIDMERDQDTGAGLTFLNSRKVEGLATPVLLYGSLRAVTMYSDQVNTEDCLLCTAGAISLLDGIDQVLKGFLERIPREPIESDQTGHLAGYGMSRTLNEPESSGWLGRLRQFSRK